VQLSVLWLAAACFLLGWPGVGAAECFVGGDGALAGGSGCSAFAGANCGTLAGSDRSTSVGRGSSTPAGTSKAGHHRQWLACHKICCFLRPLSLVLLPILLAPIPLPMDIFGGVEGQQAAVDSD